MGSSHSPFKTVLPFSVNHQLFKIFKELLAPSCLTISPELCQDY